MKICSVVFSLCVTGYALLAATAVRAEQVWVSDQSEIMLRTGPSTANAIETEQENAARRINALESEKSQLTSELAEIKRIAANVLSIDSQNKNLRQQLTDANIRINVLQDENEALASDSDRYWFLTGALVLLGGILLGLILPRMKNQRRSGYDRF